MPTLKVPTMKCEGCAATIEKAIRDIDPQATITVDLAARTVAVESAADARALSQAVRAAGYENGPA
ncbi:MAG: heavy-metal-associated domain-containing protein [Pseudochelatococcus sp.]|jgi:copper chaperone|uniref:heavy-metal-associated domain-containing protein n=1 Tax=Pseudochelatococcus sp. TaxID=2020869 RepID=UPI003D94603F